MSGPVESTLSDLQVGRYLERIRADRPSTIDRAAVEALMRAHLTAVPFENLDVFARVAVDTTVAWSYQKIVERGRGGWCFEVNGAFGDLLAALGFTVRRIGAAVLLDGPNAMIDHLALEVVIDAPLLVDVGFGRSFITPLDLSVAGPQSGGIGAFEFLASPQGATLAEDDEGVPRALYRFKRVALDLGAFEPASEALQHDETKHWRNKPFATRLLDGGPDRVTLVTDRLKVERDGEVTETPVGAQDWADALHEWFGLTMPTA